MIKIKTLFNWLNRGPSDSDTTQSLIVELSASKKNGWRDIDPRTFRWEKDIWPFWDKEVRILKILTKRETEASVALHTIQVIADDIMWGHCRKNYNGQKKLGFSRLRTISNAEAELFTLHIGSLVWSLNALNAIGGNQTELIPLIIEIFDESRPKDSPIFSAPEFERMRLTIRMTAIAALTRLSSSISQESLAVLVPNILTVLQSSEYANIVSEYANMDGNTMGKAVVVLPEDVQQQADPLIKHWNTILNESSNH